MGWESETASVTSTTNVSIQIAPIFYLPVPKFFSKLYSGIFAVGCVGLLKRLEGARGPVGGGSGIPALFPQRKCISQ